VALLLFRGVPLSVAKALLWSRGVWTAEASGYAVGALLMSSFVAYLIAGRKKNRKPVLFGLIFAGISFVLCLLELSHHPKGPNAEVADLVLEASGTKSIDRRGAFDIPQNKLLSEVMTEFLNKAKAYREKAHELEPGLQSLYAPESFSAPEAMSRTRDSVQKITALDHESALQLEQWPLAFKSKLPGPLCPRLTNKGFYRASMTPSQIPKLSHCADKGTKSKRSGVKIHLLCTTSLARMRGKSTLKTRTSSSRMRTSARASTISSTSPANSARE